MTTVRDVAMNVHVQGFVGALGIYLGVKLLGHVVLLYLVENLPDGFPQWLRLSVVSSFSTSSPTFVTFHFSDCSCAREYEAGPRWSGLSFSW